MKKDADKSQPFYQLYYDFRSTKIAIMNVLTSDRCTKGWLYGIPNYYQVKQN